MDPAGRTVQPVAVLGAGALAQHPAAARKPEASAAVEKRVVFRSAWLPYVLVAPQIVITILFFFWPAVQAVWFSFQLQDAFGLKTQFVGLQNFAALLKDGNYLESFKVTALFSALVAFFGIAISLLLATMADRVLRGALAYKTLLIWPYAVAPAIAGVLWAFLFAPSIGIVTYVLKGFGVHWNWIIQGDQALLLVVIAAVWNQISYNFLFFLAGLQSIPKSLIEAAAIDGAGPARRFWTIVFPLLSPTTFFLLVVNIVYAFFQTFGIIDVTTQGGPGQSTNILVYKVYHDGVKAADLGGSSAQSVILMAIVIALTVVQFRFIEKKVQY
jgi:sn-glycerol 3-phosphate transport system permease protein